MPRVRFATGTRRRHEHTCSGDGLGSVSVLLLFLFDFIKALNSRIGRDDLLGCCVIGKESPTKEGRQQWVECFQHIRSATNPTENSTNNKITTINSNPPPKGTRPPQLLSPNSMTKCCTTNNKSISSFDPNKSLTQKKLFSSNNNGNDSMVVGSTPQSCNCNNGVAGAEFPEVSLRKTVSVFEKISESETGWYMA